MALKVGELYVSIGVRGDTKAKDALTHVNAGMKDIASSGLAAKAAILAILYGIERFTGAAGKRGMELQQFADFTGLSAQKLQQWQYAMRMSGVEASDTMNSIQSLQQALLQMDIGQGAPKGMEQLSMMLSKFGSGFDRGKWNDAFYMMDKLREYSKLEKNSALANETMSSFGMSPAMIQAMRAGKIDPNKVSASKILDKRDVGALRDVNTAWQDFHNTLELFGEKFIAKNGLKAVNDIKMITTEVLKLITALSALADKLEVFKGLSMVFEGWGKIFQYVNYGLTADPKAPTKQEIQDTPQALQFLNKVLGLQASPQKPMTSEDYAPSMHGKGAGGGVHKTQNNNIHIHTDTKHPKDHAAIIKKEINSAYFQMNSQTMVT